MPTQGNLRIGDYPLTKETLAEARRTVGMIFQDPDDQLFMPTVFDDIAFGPLNLGFPCDEVEKRVINALETVGMVHLKDRSPYKLSAGEKRAVAIATVLSMSPNILVMDEPSSILDPEARRKLINLLKTFKHTKIMATHDLDLGSDLCERTIIMHEGKIVEDNSTIKLFMDESLLKRCHLEKPLSMQTCPQCNST